MVYIPRIAEHEKTNKQKKERDECVANNQQILSFYAFD
jgi:hypothetical protein